MLFNSLAFVQFLPLIFIAVYISKQSMRIPVLLIASYIFYSNWNPWYLWLLVGSSVLDYSVGRYLGKERSRTQSRMALASSLAGNLGLLALFKYQEFFIHIGMSLMGNTGEFEGSTHSIPPGLSFYTFQTLSYSIDVYRKKIPVEKSFLRFALYVSFFPQLVAGPIERAGNLLPQLKKGIHFDPEKFRQACRYLLVGFSLKILLADRLAIIADNVFGSIYLFQGFTVWAGLIGFSFQIFFDFQAYSLIAIGLGKLFGVDIIENFNRPYFAVNPQDFWRRWHMSLSNWFRDYVYLPMGGSRQAQAKVFLSILVVFFLSGLWHGANYNFVLWGLFHAVSLIAYLSFKKYFPVQIPRFVGRALFLLFILYSWLLFRVKAPEDIYFNSLNMWKFKWVQLKALLSPEIGISVLFLMTYLFVELRAGDKPLPKYLGEKSLPTRWLTYYAIIILMIVYGEFNATPFIYFQF